MNRRTLLAGIAALALLAPVPAKPAVITSTQNITYISATNTGGSTTNGAGVDCRSALFARFVGTVTNGGTAPGVAARANMQWSPDNSAWYTIWIAPGSLTNSAVVAFSFDVNEPAGWLRVQITGNDTQSVTVAVANGISTSMQ